jgi:NADPH-dependent 2,4-dienoyl-CoA reductase/sulfur reductase-like enzyme
VEGHPIRGTQRTLEVDTLCVGHGFLPSIALTLHLGCEHVFDPDLRTFVPRHDERMATSVPGLYVAGDVTGVGGKDLARLQGQVAGIAAAEALGHIPSAQATRQLHALRPQVQREGRFRQLLWSRFRLRPGLFDLLADDTIVCRCEAVPVSTIKAVLEEGARQPGEVKLRTRCGMGPCQGRYCSTSLSEIVARETGADPAGFAPPSVRPPLVPVRAGDLVAE